MDPDAFMLANVPGYSELSRQERDAIANFTLLWTAMEGRVLQMHVSPAGLLQIAATLAKQDHFDVHRFEPALQHFKTRYFANGAATHHFHGLHVHKFQKKEQDLIEAVLSGKAAAPEEIVAAILLVVYRLRNNLFHGVKWAYGIKDQLDNFAHANEALMQVLCLHEPM